MYCICCNKNKITPIHLDEGEKEEDSLWRRSKENKIYNIDNEMVNNGIIQILNAGYGSKHDGQQIIIAICDECISSNLENAAILHWGNYMGFDVKDDIEISKKRYKRRKNLDNLVNDKDV